MILNIIETVGNVNIFGLFFCAKLEPMPGREALPRLWPGIGSRFG